MQGPAIRIAEVPVLTRRGPAREIVDLMRKKDPWIIKYHGARFELALPPSRAYEGFVRDRDTGEGIPGVSLESYRFADFDIVNHRVLRTRTDQAGHYRLEGMPIGERNEIILMPPEDAPFFASLSKLKSPPGAGPITADFVLKHGVWAKGKVTSKADGKPMRANLRFVAAADNPLVDQAPGFRDLMFNGDYSYARPTEPDGSYRIPVLPGRGLLAVEFWEPGYYPINDPGRAKPDLRRFVPNLYGYDSFSAEIEAHDGVDLLHDFILDVERSRTVTGEILDPEGRPLANTRYSGKYDAHWWEPPMKTNQFTITELHRPAPRSVSRLIQIRSAEALESFLVPEVARPVAFVNQNRGLAGFTFIDWNTPDPVHVRLQPWGSVTGRLVDGQGQPRGNFGMQPHIILKNRLVKNEILHWQERIFTDSTGRFRVEGLAPGLNYRLFYEDMRGIRGNRGVDITPLKPGESRDLGDIKVVVTGEST